MVRSLSKFFVLLALIFAGATQVKAQEQIEPLSPDVRHRCDSILGLAATPEEMKKPFVDFLRKYMKDAEQMYRAAEYFASKGNYSCSQFCIEKAYEKKPKNVDILKLRGEIYERAKRTDLASTSYDGILALDSTNHYALMKAAGVDQYQNELAAIERLEKVKELYPDDIAADKQLGYQYYRLATQTGSKVDSIVKKHYKLSVKHYENWFNATPVDTLALEKPGITSDYYYCTQYLYGLADAKSFAKGIKACEKIESRAPEKYKKDIKQLNLLFLLENYDLPGARQAMGYITNKEFPDTAYKYVDYNLAAQLCDAEGNLPEAIQWQTKAVEVDPQRAKEGGRKKLFDYLFQNNQYAEALPVYQQYLEDKRADKAATYRDSAMLGTIYVQLATKAHSEKDSLELAKWIELGDSLFAEMSRNVPDELYAPFTRADLNRLRGDGYSKEAMDCYIDVLHRIEESKHTTDGLMSQDAIERIRVQVINYLTFYYDRLNNVEETMSYVMRLNTHQEQVAALQALLEESYFNQKDYKKTLEYLAKMEQLEPSHKWVSYKATIEHEAAKQNQ